MKTKISRYLSSMIPEISETEIYETIEIPPEDTMGDFAIPCFTFAKKLKQNPALIAMTFAEKLNEYKDYLGIQTTKQAGAYCNIFLKREVYIKNCFEKMQKENLGVAKSGSGKTVCIDYSSPNIAKNFHVGHLRTTIIGNSLYKIYDKLGYQVVRINYLGDWGTQFGKLIVAYKLWSSEDLVQEKGIEELLRIYVKFNEEAKENENLMDKAREWFVRMEQKDEEALAIWKWFKEISMTEFQRVYDLLGMSFDSYVGESFYCDKVPQLVAELKQKHLLIESQGAQVIDMSEYGMPPCLITKSDGGSIYHSRDIAAMLDRQEKYDFDQCLYVTGLEQTLHFQQIFKAIEVMGYDWSNQLVHVPYGLVSLAGEKLSTRNGNIIYAEDILKEAIERAQSAIEQKNPNLKNKEEVARIVGVGAVIYHDLFNQRIKNINFSWDEVLNFEGTTGPYVQYTYARTKSILKKAKIQKDEIEKGEKQKDQGQKDQGQKEYILKLNMQENKPNIELSKLTDDITFKVVKILANYEDTIHDAMDKKEPSIIARYVMNLATNFNKFYHECPILQAEESVKQARLALTDTVQSVMKDACDLLGMQCPENM